MNDAEKKKIGAFIAYHNIIRPIEYPLFGLVFISALMMLFFLRFTVSPPQQTHSVVLWVVGLGVSASAFLAGFVIRRKLLEAKINAPGKSMYYVEMIKYLYLAMVSVLLILSVVNFLYGTNTMLLAFITAIVLMVVTLIAAYLLIRKMIGDGRYLDKKHISDKVIAFSASTGCMVLYLTVFQFMRRLMNVHGVVILMTMASDVSAVLALIYYLKLRYAKKYGLEEYFPTRPNPSPYTNWE